MHSKASAEGDNARIAVNRPRDLKQIQNLKYSEDLKKRNKDDLFATLQLAYQIEFIRIINFFPDLVVLAWKKEITDLAKDLLTMAQNDPTTNQMISYDTTFNLGDFYVSSFVLRNTILQNDPIFPVAFMIHERKFQKHHEKFISELSPSLDLSSIKHIPVVTDREKGIISAFNKVLPNIPLVLCGNHILKDVEFWVKRAGGKKDDIKVLKDHIEQLRNAESKEEWVIKYEQFRILWSESFSNYFEKYLHEPMFQFSSRFYTKQFHAFKNKTSTNNVSESMNRILKDATDWKELPLDSILLCFEHLQTFYLYEFERAQYGLGKFRLKATFQDLLKRPTEHTQFPDYLPIEKIVFKVKSQNPDTTPTINKQSCQRMTQTSIANLCIERNLVSLNTQLQVFIVKNPFKKEVHSVFLSPKPSCSCKSSGLCFHIIAVQKATGIFIQDTFSYCLSTLRKQARKKRCEGKSGRKKPRKEDYAYITEPAPDSMLARSTQFATKEETSIIELSSESNSVDLIVEDFPCPKNTSTPKKINIQKENYPWHNIEGDFDIRTPCLKPQAWLEGDILDSALINIIKSSALSSCCFAVPTHYFHAVANGGYLPFLKLADHMSLLNFDALLFPINTDLSLYGGGVHWLLAVADLRQKKVIILDSLSNNAYDKYCQIIQKILYGIYALCSNVQYLETEWTWIVSADCPKQNNAYDCGLHVLIHTYSICNGLQYIKNFDSLKVRKWLDEVVKLLDYQHMEKKGEKIHQRISQKMLTYNPPMIQLMERNTEEDIRNFASHYGSAEGWTMCSSSHCFLDLEHEEKQIFCVICRKWYHQKCEASKGRIPTYYICLQCKRDKIPS